jgi:Ni/Co efflux regulator RcnB
MDRWLAMTIVLVLAGASAAPALAQQKRTYYYHPVTREGLQQSSSTHNVYRNRDEDEFQSADDAVEDDGRPLQRKRYTYTPVRRDRHLYSPYRYQPNVRYPTPQGHRSGIWWGVGNRLPSVYYAPMYLIDHQRYRLPPPPSGFRWVRVENDVYLVNSASGVVRDALYQLFY